MVTRDWLGTIESLGPMAQLSEMDTEAEDDARKLEDEQHII